VGDTLKMPEIIVDAHNIITSLGFSTAENMKNLQKGITGVKYCDDTKLSPNPFMVSLVDSLRLDDEFSALGNPRQFTRFEKLLILSVANALKKTTVSINNPKTLLIISTTKGNVELLTPTGKAFSKERVYLWETARIIGKFFKNPNTPVVISNACISGVLAINVASAFLCSGKYENVVVSGGDAITKFVVSGFQSFQSLSPNPCKPFDVSRDGLNLGEGSGTLILTTKTIKTDDNVVITVKGGGSSNDANHISGPSRTGDGLFFAIQRALDQAGYLPDKIDFISAHGTATSFNDEMESKAFNMAKMSNIPLNSVKGYIGHTLGGAGIIESGITIGCLNQNLLLKNLGYTESGIPFPLNVITENCSHPLHVCLKTASGFGGCNAAVIFEKKK